MLIGRLLARAAGAPGIRVIGVICGGWKKMYQNRVALPSDVKKEVVEKMQVTLASASDMYSQSKFAHWNVKGDNFYQLHLIGKQADPIAERITQLGGIANGTVRQAALGMGLTRP
jgi:DNA-binding ferritin-like protein